MEILVRALHPDAVLPEYAHEHDAGCDLVAIETCVALVNLDPESEYVVHKGDRIAQLVVVPVASLHFSVVDELPEAIRGDGGFGSSGR